MDGKRVRNSTQHIVSLDADGPDKDLNAFIEDCDEEERQITIGFIKACSQSSPHLHQQILSSPATVATPQPSK